MASYGLLSYFKSDYNFVKGKLGLLNKYNKTRCLANNNPLATTS